MPPRKIRRNEDSAVGTDPLQGGKGSNNNNGAASIPGDGTQDKTENTQLQERSKESGPHKCANIKDATDRNENGEADGNDKKDCFNVHEEMKTLTFREKRHLNKSLTILTLNIGGLRSSYKKDSLIALAQHLQFSIGIITEPRLLENEVETVVVPKYKIIEKSGSSKHRGGVIVLINKKLAAKKIAQGPSSACTTGYMPLPTLPV